MKTKKTVSVAVVLVAILIASTTRTFSVSVCGDNADASTSPSCCNRTVGAAQPHTDRDHDAAAAALSPAAPANSPALTLAVNTETQFQSPVAAEVTRLLLQGNQNLLTSAATDLKEALAFAPYIGVRSGQARDSLTNGFNGIQTLAADTSGKETKTFPVEFARQTDTVSATMDLLSVRRDFTLRSDALISGSKATGLSFAFGRSARSGSSISGSRADEWPDRPAATFSGWPRSGSWSGEDANREPQGLWLFSWSW